MSSIVPPLKLLTLTLFGFIKILHRVGRYKYCMRWPFMKMGFVVIYIFIAIGEYLTSFFH